MSFHLMSASPRHVILAATSLFALAAIPASYQLGREQGIRSERARYVPSDLNGQLIFLPKSKIGFEQAGVRNTVPQTHR